VKFDGNQRKKLASIIIIKITAKTIVFTMVMVKPNKTHTKVINITKRDDRLCRLPYQTWSIKCCQIQKEKIKRRGLKNKMVCRELHLYTIGIKQYPNNTCMHNT